MRYLYSVAVLDWLLELPGESARDRERLVRRAAVSMRDSGAVLSDRLNFVFLQLPMVRGLSGGEDFLGDLAYVIRNISGMEGEPESLGGEYFGRLFKASERDSIGERLLEAYDNMIRDEIQIRAERDYAVEKALAEGEAKGIAQRNSEVAKNMLALGIDAGTVAKATGLDAKAIDKLRQSA